MRVSKASVTYERKFNLGDYNSATVGVTIWSDLEEGENETDAVRLLQEVARDHVKAEAMRLTRKPKPQEASEKP